MRSILRRPLLGALALAGATALNWYLWLGRDTEYDVDPVTQIASGPYSVPQVAGCLLTMVVLLVAAVLAGVPRWVAAAAMTVSFTVAWTAQAASVDESGLYVIGAAMVAAGMTVGTVVVAAITDAVKHPHAPAPASRG
ncbi:hypothetical protein AB0J80_06805 [Actinoplanes sp. NPDC049548]|uniref:hypothetical protein n=1 Tax=Actinoplanes sp. NPDC049548 TaxID=3155152 RepID=UPI003432203C